MSDKETLAQDFISTADELKELINGIFTNENAQKNLNDCLDQKYLTTFSVRFIKLLKNHDSLNIVDDVDEDKLNEIVNLHNKLVDIDTETKPRKLKERIIDINFIIKKFVAAKSNDMNLKKFREIKTEEQLTTYLESDK
jgi:hypothetical protein